MKQTRFHVISASPYKRSWGDFIHLGEEGEKGMRQSVRRKAGVILIQRRIMTSRTKHRGWMVHHHGPRARLSPDFSLDLTRRLGTPKHCAGWGERVLASDLQLTLWQPHLPRDAGGGLWYPAGLTLSSHPLLLAFYTSGLLVLHLHILALLTPLAAGQGGAGVC